jgi:hypothetical protein
MRKKRLTEFTIDEISLVDRPAQKGARVLLRKSEGAPVGKRAVLTDRDGSGHQHMVEDSEDVQSGRTSYDQEHSHVWVRHADGTIEVGQEAGHSHSVGGTISKQEDMTMATFTKAELVAKRDDAAGKIEEMARDLAKSRGWDYARAYSAAVQSPEGRRLYAEYSAAHEQVGGA